MHIGQRQANGHGQPRLGAWETLARNWEIASTTFTLAFLITWGLAKNLVETCGNTLKNWNHRHRIVGKPEGEIPQKRSNVIQGPGIPVLSGSSFHPNSTKLPFSWSVSSQRGMEEQWIHALSSSLHMWHHKLRICASRWCSMHRSWPKSWLPCSCREFILPQNSPSLCPTAFPQSVGP